MGDDDRKKDSSSHSLSPIVSDVDSTTVLVEESLKASNNKV